jgi:uracil phosphoribosyltransferase
MGGTKKKRASQRPPDRSPTPLVQHKLTLMRNKDASTNSFRRLLGELASADGL